MKPLIYLAGPITKPDPNVNAHDAIRVADQLMDDYPITLFIPHLSVVHQLVQPKTHQKWLEYDFGIIRHCDALFRLPGASIGADMEVQWADVICIPVFYLRHAPAMMGGIMVEGELSFMDWLDRRMVMDSPSRENALADARADIEAWAEEQKANHADYGLTQ